MNKKQQAAQKMRQHIIATAHKIISTEGVSALTSRNLLDRAGISRGALYHHFDSLDDVVVAVILEGCDVPEKEASVVNFTANGSISLTEFLDFAEKQLFSQISNQQDEKLDEILFEGKILPKIITDDYVRLEISKKEIESRERIVDVLTLALAKPEKRVLVDLVFSTTSGLVFKHLVKRDQKAIKAQWKYFKSMVLSNCENLT